MVGGVVVCAALPSVGCSNSPSSGMPDMAFPTIYTVYTIDPMTHKQRPLMASEIPANNFFFATGPGVNINICRDSGGLFAQDADCTHAQCLLEFSNDNTAVPPQWKCNCHGSLFDFNGNVLNPPAPKPLVHYQLTINSDQSITFDLSKIVDSSTRAMG
jgi:nitrite reductase/ring-hydroxylating ferredoxin subunit